jgi:hypothetical protein
MYLEFYIFKAGIVSRIRLKSTSNQIERVKGEIVIYITNAVGYILQSEVLRLTRPRNGSVLTKTEQCKMPSALVMYY